MAARLEPHSVQLKQREFACPNVSTETIWKDLVDSNKYLWLDNQGRFGVELYARALDITWGSSPEYWTYFCEKIPNTDYTVEVARLLNVCWLEVKGEFDMKKLTEGSEYEILFDIELICGARGWSFPVKFEYNIPFGSMNKFEMKLDHLKGQGRAQIPIGKFTLPSIPVDTPNATFRMYEYVGGMWKNGLIMYGVIIKPVKEVLEIPICSSF